MSRRVRGSFFAEYVRMIRRRKDVDWERVLTPRDFEYVEQHVEPDEWYPMETFERLGVAILTHIEGASLDAVRFWGRFSASQLATEHPSLIAPGDPVESLMRLKVLRSTMFDFPAFDIPTLIECLAHVTVDYRMGPVAEEAASVQTLGFCEGVLTLAGARDVRAELKERVWTGDPRTLFVLEWSNAR